MNNAQILIVEDEVLIAMGLQNKLEKLGYKVLAIAASGEEAIATIMGDHPDLVLMDIVLKGEMDGIETARRIKDQFQIPVIYLSAYGDEKILDRAKTTEPFGYLLKPFNERELQISIDIALYKHNMQKKIKGQEQWYSTILKSLGEAVITIGINHSILFMNPAAEEMFNVRYKEVVGKRFDECITFKRTATQVDFTGLVEAVLTAKTTIRKTGLTLGGEGTALFVDLCLAPIQTDEGLIKGAAFVFTNKTEQKNLQELMQTHEKSFETAREIVINLLTEREKEVLGLIVAGKTTKEIAALLGISPRTIEFHRYNLMRKLKVKDIPSLVRHAIIQQIVPVS